MEATAQEETKQKHEKLTEGEAGTQEEVILPQNKFIKNTASPFLSKSKVWTDQEHFGKIPEDILANIENEVQFKTPSNI